MNGNRTKSLKKNSYRIFDEISKTYDNINKILSLGIDRYWRFRLKKALPKRENLEILDLATGTGDIAFLLAQEKNCKKVIGLDLSREMLRIANEKLPNSPNREKIKFIRQDGVTANFPRGSFDVVTVSFGIRNFHSLDIALDKARALLKENGVFLVLELSLPKNFIIKQLYLFYFRYLLPFFGRLLSGHKDAYRYLNESVEDFPSGENFKDLLTKAKFSEVTYHPMTFGVATLYVARK